MRVKLVLFCVFACLFAQSFATLYKVKVDIASASKKTEGKLYLTLPTVPPTEVQLHDHSSKIKPAERIVFTKDLPVVENIQHISARYRKRNLLQEDEVKIERIIIEKVDQDLKNNPNATATAIAFCGNRPHVLEDEKWEVLHTSRC